MALAAIGIRGIGPQTYNHGCGEVLDEGFGAVVPLKGNRRGKIPWETHKDYLHKIYLEEDKPLNDVMRIMKECGFDATQKQCMWMSQSRIGNDPFKGSSPKWKWKKYGQDVSKLTPVRTRKPRSQINLGDAQEDEIVVASDESEVPGRDNSSTRTPPPELFTSRQLDEKCLENLRNGNPHDVSRCLSLCLRWCKQQIQSDDTVFPPPYGNGRDTETNIPDGDYGCDAGIFIYLLHRYVKSLIGPGSWDTLAQQTLGFSPIKMLYTMSTMIVGVVSNALNSSQEAGLYTPAPSPSALFDDLPAVAKRGISEMDRYEWDDEKLVAEFCGESEAILEDYANYGDVINRAIREYYVAQSWLGSEAPEELGFADNHDDPFSDMYAQDDAIFPLDDMRMD